MFVRKRNFWDLSGRTSWQPKWEERLDEASILKILSKSWIWLHLSAWTCSTSNHYWFWWTSQVSSSSHQIFAISAPFLWKVKAKWLYFDEFKYYEAMKTIYVARLLKFLTPRWSVIFSTADGQTLGQPQISAIFSRFSPFWLMTKPYQQVLLIPSGV